MSASLRGTKLYWIATFLLFFVPALILVCVDFNYSNPAFAALDQRNGHLPTIRYFALHWGSFDIRHSTRSGPGYYLLMGAIDRWITDNVAGLRFFNLLITGVLLGVQAFSLNAVCKSPLAAALAWPFFFCASVYTRGVWLSTDNLAWLGVLAVLLIALRPVLTGTAIAAAAVIVAALVSVRQIHAWTIPFLILAVLTVSGTASAVRMAAALLPTLMLIGWFIYTWRGLEPPIGQAHYAGFSLAALPMVFSLFGILGAFYATAIWPELRRRLRESPRDFKPYLLAGLAVGLAAGLVPHTTFDSFFRRSGIWVLARHTPVFFGRSVAITMLTISGALACGVLFTVLTRRDRAIFGAALLCFAVVQCANRSIFERYYEPFILLVLALATARIAAGGDVRTSWRARAAGPLLLGLLQIGYTIWSLSTPFHRAAFVR